LRRSNSAGLRVIRRWSPELRQTVKTLLAVR
jgi:hypothetical protein